MGAILVAGLDHSTGIIETVFIPHAYIRTNSRIMPQIAGQPINVWHKSLYLSGELLIIPQRLNKHVMFTKGDPCTKS